MPLTSAELRIVNELGFDQSTAEFVRAQTRSALERLQRLTPTGNAEPAEGLSVAVSDGNEAERLMNAISSHLKANGFRAFWSMRHASSGLKESDEVAILKTADEYAMVRLRATNGANYGVSTADIIDRLSAWKEICAFNVVGADHDWVAIQFTRQPEKICKFAEEVYQFCPDSVQQGVGLRREKDHPQQFQDARLLCPEIAVESKTMEEGLRRINAMPPEQAEEFKRLMALAAKDSTPTDMGVRLLALEISRRSYLFLWWD